MILSRLKLLVVTSVKELRARCVHWTKPLTSSLLLGTLVDLGRSKSELIAENALLRQQLIMLKRQVNRPACTKTDRILLVLLARAVRAWKQALFLVQPDTLLRWHRELFRLYWKRRSKASSHKPKVAAETIALIREMATENRLWGAERIRGELLKLGSMCVSAPSRSTSETFVHPSHEDRGGPPFYTITPHRSGPATSYRSRISSFDRSLLSSSSNCSHAR